MSDNESQVSMPTVMPSQAWQAKDDRDKTIEMVHDLNMGRSAKEYRRSLEGLAETADDTVFGFANPGGVGEVH